MKPLTREWVEKADADLHSAERELRARKYINYDSACFHAQQCVEKYIKARLTEANIFFPKTHELTYLLELVRPVEPLWTAYAEAFRLLTDYEVEFRYPGQNATKEEAQEAIRLCKNICATVRQSLGLPE